MAQLTLSQLFNDKQERLSLTWLAGLDGGGRVLDSKKINASNKGLVGHLNLTHPNWVQVFSDTEFDYLNSLSPAEFEQSLAQLEASGAQCLIASGARNIPQALMDYANRTQTPLLHSPQPSVHMLWLMRDYIVKTLAESTSLHGVFLDVLGVGVLITGDSGVGKSELGLELITRGNGLVADDVTEIYRIAPDTLEGRSPSLLRDFLEVRGLGVLNIRTMFGETAVRRKKNLKLIVHLHRPPGGDLSQLERLPLSASYQEVLGVQISTVSIPVVAGRNLAVLVEAAARNFVMKQRGIDTMQEFIGRHEQHLSEQ
jgi:HPr kinase/phosphorylase